MENRPIPNTSLYPMKWHKFQIFFSLWVNALLNLSSGCQYGLGTHYSGYTKQVYLAYPGLITLDKLMAVTCIALAIYSIVIRFALARYEKRGPKMLITANLLNALVPIVYVVLVSTCTALSLTDLIDSNIISSALTCIALAIYNRSYYRDRATLFVN